MPSVLALLSLLLLASISGLERLANAVKASTTIPRVAVVGGGAAGYFSAIECARILSEEKRDFEVLILEAGKSPLSKVLISGGGRCNVMHDPLKGATEISKGYVSWQCNYYA
jgi:succinate dehydrogenase/fumarate reductase flavoprotein subunit